MKEQHECAVLTKCTVLRILSILTAFIYFKPFQQPNIHVSLNWEWDNIHHVCTFIINSVLTGIIVNNNLNKYEIWLIRFIVLFNRKKDINNFIGLEVYINCLIVVLFHGSYKIYLPVNHLYTCNIVDDYMLYLLIIFPYFLWCPKTDSIKIMNPEQRVEIFPDRNLIHKCTIQIL